jgi:hypothetical protein
MRTHIALGALAMIAAGAAATPARSDDWQFPHIGGTFILIRATGQEATTDGSCPSAVCTAGHVCSCVTLATTKLNGASGTKTAVFGSIGIIGTLTASLTVDTTAATPNGSGGSCMPASGTGKLALKTEPPTTPDKGEVEGNIEVSLAGQACSLPPNAGAASFTVSAQGTGGSLTDSVHHYTVLGAAGSLDWNDDGTGNTHLVGQIYAWVPPVK